MAVRIYHGEAASGQQTPEYRTWKGMIKRCHNPRSTRFRYYGGRGIAVCDEWRHDYPAFLAYVGRRPTPQHSIERINNDLGYQPGNVKWANIREQRANRRTAVRMTFNGETNCAAEWARRSGICFDTIVKRIKLGLPPEKVLFKGRLVYAG